VGTRLGGQQKGSKKITIPQITPCLSNYLPKRGGVGAEGEEEGTRGVKGACVKRPREVYGKIRGKSKTWSRVLMGQAPGMPHRKRRGVGNREARLFGTGLPCPGLKARVASKDKQKGREICLIGGCGADTRALTSVLGSKRGADPKTNRRRRGGTVLKSAWILSARRKRVEKQKPDARIAKGNGDPREGGVYGVAR